jgi:hypothetical protein
LEPSERIETSIEILSSGFERFLKSQKKVTEAEMADVEKLIENLKKMMMLNVYHTMEEAYLHLL